MDDELARLRTVLRGSSSRPSTTSPMVADHLRNAETELNAALERLRGIHAGKWLQERSFYALAVGLTAAGALLLVWKRQALARIRAAGDRDRGGAKKADELATLSRQELHRRAQTAGVPGRSKMK
jgi:hypothetical protein